MNVSVCANACVSHFILYRYHFLSKLVMATDQHHHHISYELCWWMCIGVKRAHVCSCRYHHFTWTNKSYLFAKKREFFVCKYSFCSSLNLKYVIIPELSIVAHGWKCIWMSVRFGFWYVSIHNTLSNTFFQLLTFLRFALRSLSIQSKNEKRNEAI